MSTRRRGPPRRVGPGLRELVVDLPGACRSTCSRIAPARSPGPRRRPVRLLEQHGQRRLQPCARSPAEARARATTARADRAGRLRNRRLAGATSLGYSPSRRRADPASRRASRPAAGYRRDQPRRTCSRPAIKQPRRSPPQRGMFEDQPPYPGRVTVAERVTCHVTIARPKRPASTGPRRPAGGRAATTAPSRATPPIDSRCPHRLDARRAELLAQPRTQTTSIVFESRSNDCA